MIVEDGSGLATATSLVSLDAADAYLAAEANATWAGADQATRETALVAASRWLSAAFEWRGDPVSSDQALAWPRVERQSYSFAGSQGYFAGGYVYGNPSGPLPEGVPTQVANAVARLAAYALGVDLWAAQGRPRIEVKAGSVRVEYERHFTGGVAGKSLPWLSGMLRGLTLGGAGSSSHRVLRA